MPSKDFARPQDLRGRSAQDLAFFVKDKEAELMKLKFQHVTGQLENTAKLAHVRREIGRARTILTEKHKAEKRG
jgi:large subunit ribosomal protein L29